MPRRTWQVNYSYVSKESYVSTLRRVYAELPETDPAFTLASAEAVNYRKHVADSWRVG